MRIIHIYMRIYTALLLYTKGVLALPKSEQNECRPFELYAQLKYIIVRLLVAAIYARMYRVEMKYILPLLLKDLACVTTNEIFLYVCNYIYNSSF